MSADLVIADRTKSLAYVEGFRIDKFGLFHHGWVELGGKVVDVTVWGDNPDVHTLRPGAPVLGEFGPTVSYVGVRIPTGVLLRSGRLGGTVLDDSENGFPVIRSWEAVQA